MVFTSVLPLAGVAPRRAFQGLAYTKIDRVPLYLEWAPIGIFTAPSASGPGAGAGAGAGTGTGAEAGVVSGVVEGGDAGGDVVVEESRTVYVKNLNFSSTEEGLRGMLGGVGDVRAVMIPRRKKKEDGVEVLRSMGYGFVEFGTKEGAMEAIKRCVTG